MNTWDPDQPDEADRRLRVALRTPPVPLDSPEVASSIERRVARLRRRRRALVAGVSIAAATGISLAALGLAANGHPPTHVVVGAPDTASGPINEPNRTIGTKLGDSLLSQVPLPPGSVSTTHALAKPLEKPPSQLGTANLIDESRLWIVPLNVSDTMNFLNAHVPTGMHQEGYGDGETFSWTQFDLTSLPSGIYSVRLSESVAALPTGRSELRLDALVVWIPQRPPSELVPNNVKVVTVTRTPGAAETPAGLQPVTVTVTDPQQIAHLVQIFNSLSATPTVQCVPPPEPTYRIAFATSTAGEPVLVASGGACHDLAVTTWTYPANGQPLWQAKPDLALTGTLSGLLDSLALKQLPGGTTGSLTSPPAGFYVDGTDGMPHYVLSVTSTPTGFAGWMFFVYQDGHVSEIFHYHSTATTPDLLLAIRMITDTTNEAFPYPHVPPGSLAGSQQVPAGRTFSGTYGSNGIALSDCGAYLYWASPANDSKPMSCTFSYSGTTTW